MSRKQFPPAAYRQNANGTVTVTGFAKPVIIAKHIVEHGKIFNADAAGRWTGPIPSQCYTCSQPAYFQTKSVRQGEELLVITYKCANCGASDVDYLD